MGLGFKFREDIKDPGTVKELDSLYKFLQTNQVSGLANHVADRGNPHGVTVAQIGAVATSRLSQGVYTPTFTGTTNVASSTPSQCQYVKVDSVVTVSGQIDVTPTAAGATELQLTLPVSSDFTAAGQCAGTACNAVSLAAGICADTSTNRARVRFTAPSGAAQTFYFTVSYQIL